MGNLVRILDTISFGKMPEKLSVVMVCCDVNLWYVFFFGFLGILRGSCCVYVRTLNCVIRLLQEGLQVTNLRETATLLN